jgi:hypothetical protein
MILILSLFACGLDNKTEGDAPHCEDTRSALAPEEVSALGFSANELLPLAAGEFSETLIYKDESSTALLLSFTPDLSAVAYVDSEAVYPDTEGANTADIGVICEDRLEVGGTLSFATEDGLFADVFSGVLSAMEVATASLTVDLMEQASAGTFEPESYPTDVYDSMSMGLVATWNAQGSSGVISGSTLHDEGCDGDICSASSEQLEVGSWE